jgi:hypothetical protein
MDISSLFGTVLLYMRSQFHIMIVAILVPSIDESNIVSVTTVLNTEGLKRAMSLVVPASETTVRNSVCDCAPIRHS